MSSLDPAIVDYIRDAAFSDRYGAYLRNTLVDLCSINTAPDGRLADNAARERQLFDWVEREVRDLLGTGAAIERPPIDPAIAYEPGYGLPGYAADPTGRVPPADRIYADRSNLLVIVPGNDADAGLVLFEELADAL